MNLTNLFEIQGGLDAHITKQKGLEGQDLLPKKILALQVELGELANEWRGFKFWSADQKARIRKVRYPQMNEEDKEYYNPLLEEYVDCLHFILSIGLEKSFNEKEFLYFRDLNFGVYTETDTIKQFINTFTAISEFLANDSDLEAYEEILLYFIGLGEHMGFTLEQIEQAYLAKNEINHNRQINGY